MPPRPRPKVHFISRTREDDSHIVTLAINGTRHAYHLPSAPCADTVEFLCRKVSALKALAYAKSRARVVLRT